MSPKPNTKPMVDLIAERAALLSAVEVGLGSVLHAFRVPMAGHFLSLNQGLILGRSVLDAAHSGAASSFAARTAPATISQISALLKSLSPAGKKLTPMLAISAQGILFSAGTTLLGPNAAGVLVGIVLLSMWAFVQPVLIYLLLYGRTLLDVGEYFLEKLNAVFSVTSEELLAVGLGLVGLKITAAIAVGLLAIRLPQARVERYFGALLRRGHAGRSRGRAGAQQDIEPQATATVAVASSSYQRLPLSVHVRSALRDLFHPLFMVSLAVTAAFFVLSESSHSRMIWGLLRPVAVGFLIFLVIRVLPFERLTAPDGDGRSSRGPFMRALRLAVMRLKELR